MPAHGFARCTCSLLVVLVTAAVAPAAESLPLPPLAGTERGAYRTRDLATGGELGRGEWELRRETRDGRPIVQLEERGEDVSEQAGGTAWRSEMRLDLSGAHPVLSATRESRDAEGRPVRIERRDFDYSVGSGEQTTLDVRSGARTSHSVRLTRETVTTELLPAVLRLLPARADREFRVDLVTQEGRSVGMQARVVGRERVAVPAGDFDCFKVELEPTGLLAALMKVKRVLGHTVAAPHFWVKYEGPAGAASARPVARELVRFETTDATDPARESLRSAPAGSAAVRPGPRGRRHLPDPASLGWLLVAAAIVFELGVESARHLEPQRSSTAKTQDFRDARP